MIFGIAPAIGSFAIVEHLFDLLVGIRGTPIGGGHGFDALIFMACMPGEPGGAEGCAFVACGRLNENAMEAGGSFDYRNEQRIQEQSAGETQGILAGLLSERFEPIRENDAAGLLKAGGDDGARGIRHPGNGGVSIARDAEGAIKFAAEGIVASESAMKVLRVEVRRPLRVAAQHREKSVRENGFGGKAEPLGFVLVGVGTEAKEGGGFREEPAKGMRKRNAREFTNRGAFTDADEPGETVALFIEADEQGAPERGGEVRAGGVRKMMIESFDAR